MSNFTSRKVQYLAGICVSFAFTFTGAVTAWPSPAIPKLLSGEVDITITNVQISWAVSLVGLGSLIGCYLGILLNDKAGRRRTVFCSAVPGCIGAGIILITKTPEVICAARFIIGVGNGITAVVSMIYLTEIADKEIRGSLGMLVLVMNNLGSVFVYGVGPFISYTSLNSMVVLVPVLFALMCLWIPESPYYHLTRGNIAEARKTFAYIKGSKNEKWIDEQLQILRMHVEESMENKTSIKELLTNMRYRKSVYIVIGLKILQYMTGSLAIQSYLEIIFRQSSSISGPYVSIVFGFVQLGAGVAATFLTGYFGRRILMMISSLGVAISLTIIGIYFYLQDYISVSPDVLKSITALPLIGLFGFIILYCTGLGNLPYIMQAELFPINIKTIASSTATMLSCILYFTVTRSYQGIKDMCGHYTVFWCFATVGYVGVLFIYLYVPETKGKTLEELQDNMNKEMVEIKPLSKEETI